MCTVRLVPGGEWVARNPEVFVRELSPAEGQRLQKVTRRSKDPVRLRRATIVMASAQGRSVPDIAELFATTEGYVRRVVHDFNEHGFGALDPKWSSGLPARIDARSREEICRIARCQPSDLGLAFSVWSLTKLVDYLVRHRVVEQISTETVRQILKNNITWQATKTWKTSNDPQFTEKKNAILDLYDHRPAEGRVICVDEFGPLNLQPRPGRGWFPTGRPSRLRATYHRLWRGAAHVRCPGPGHRADAVPLPRPQTPWTAATTPTTPSSRPRSAAT